MSFCEWIKNLFGKQEKATSVPIEYEIVSFTTSDGNYVQGEIYQPRRPNGHGIVYCHGGFVGSVTPDVQIYPMWGYTTLHLDFEGAPAVKASDPNRDITEVKDAYGLLRSKGVTGDIYLVGVSRGGYVATLAFAYHHKLFKKMVDYIGPINPLDPNYNWSVFASESRRSGQDVVEVKEYFSKAPTPYGLAKEEKYSELKDKMLLLYGGQDRICPPGIMCYPFVRIVGCKHMVFPKLSHNVHMDSDAQLIALRWLKK